MKFERETEVKKEYITMLAVKIYDLNRNHDL